MSAGMALSTAVHVPWQLVATWGVLTGLGVGCLALVFGAIVANRWFVARRGLVMGVFSRRTRRGALFLPRDRACRRRRAGARPCSRCRCWPCCSCRSCCCFCASVLPTSACCPTARPKAGPSRRRPTTAASDQRAWRSCGCARASRTRAFWLLVGGFFVCGWSTNGLVGTHFISAAHDHGLLITTGATLLAFIGIFDVVGTIGSGWLTDRFDPRVLLLVYYGLRGVSL